MQFGRTRGLIRWNVLQVVEDLKEQTNAISPRFCMIPINGIILDSRKFFSGFDETIASRVKSRVIVQDLWQL